ncbi:MAG: YfcE family phosphodiesterase [Candidatus Pacebacteria bacterium]|nr:YfcE family phosphodiesterase [Candidatus Paceibacterota bacterium]
MPNIAIISDTHNNEPNLKKALAIIEKEKIKTIIHCGDVSSFEFLKQNFSLKTYVSLGNTDIDDFQDYKNIKIFKDYGELENLAFCHYPEKARILAESQKYDFVFYGHTHKPWQENIKKCIIANPGNLAGLIFRPSFAILKNNKLELKIL